MPPSSVTVCATSACTAASSVTSVGTAIARRPLRAATSAAAALSLSSVRAARTTSTPSAARACAIARPMPWLAPVTMARLAVSCRSNAFLFYEC